MAKGVRLSGTEEGAFSEQLRLCNLHRFSSLGVKCDIYLLEFFSWQPHDIQLICVLMFPLKKTQ